MWSAHSGAMRTRSLDNIKRNLTVRERLLPLWLTPRPRIFCFAQRGFLSTKSLWLKILPVNYLFSRFCRANSGLDHRNSNEMNNLQKPTKNIPQSRFSVKSLFWNILGVNSLFSRFCAPKVQSDLRNHNKINILLNCKENGMRSHLCALVQQKGLRPRDRVVHMDLYVH
jgi:hypothetical protein